MLMIELIASGRGDRGSNLYIRSPIDRMPSHEFFSANYSMGGSGPGGLCPDVDIYLASQDPVKILARGISWPAYLWPSQRCARNGKQNHGI
jgi:hypothetical protein